MILDNKKLSRLDNDQEYLQFLEAAISLADPLSTGKIEKTLNKIHVIVKPSQQDFREHLISTLLDAHYRLGIKIIFSSSLKISKNIYFYFEI